MKNNVFEILCGITGGMISFISMKEIQSAVLIAFLSGAAGWLGKMAISWLFNEIMPKKKKNGIK